MGYNPESTRNKDKLIYYPLYMEYIAIAIAKLFILLVYDMRDMGVGVFLSLIIFSILYIRDILNVVFCIWDMQINKWQTEWITWMKWMIANECMNECENLQQNFYVHCTYIQFLF